MPQNAFIKLTPKLNDHFGHAKRLVLLRMLLRKEANVAAPVTAAALAGFRRNVWTENPSSPTASISTMCSLVRLESK